MQTINAPELKAHCLSILDRVRATGERVVVLRRGQPVAELGPAAEALARYPQMDFQGTVSVVGDILGPVLRDCDWENNH